MEPEPWKLVAVKPGGQEWYRINDFILYGYRPPNLSLWGCVRSIFRVHNETGNIWTHLLAFICYFMLALRLMVCGDFHFLVGGDRLMFYLFLLGGMQPFFFSFLYHTFNCYSKSAHFYLVQLDYTFILLALKIIVLTLIYFAFMCYPTMRYFYLVFAGVLGLAVLAIAWFPAFNKHEFRGIRAVIFSIYGLMSVGPVLYIVLTDFNGQICDPIIMTFIGGYMVGIVGSTCYAIGFPERTFPGRFDICFHSHQLMHVTSAVMGFFAYKSISNFIKIKLNTSCSRDPNHVTHLLF